MTWGLVPWILLGALIPSVIIEREWPASSWEKAAIRFALSLLIFACVFPLGLFFGVLFVVSSVYLWARS